MASANPGCRAAIHDSLVSSAKANGVEPFAWLREIFARLPQHRGGEAFEQSATDEPIVSDELDYLLPDIWLKSHPDQTWTIAHIRRAESYAKDV